MTLRTAAILALIVIAGALCVIWLSSSQVVAGDEVDAAEHFTLEVLPLLEAKCIACHGGDPAEIKGGLDLTSFAGILRGGESEQPIIVPGEPDKGLLIEAIRRTGLEMPPKLNDRLTKTQVAVFEEWISAGAPWPSEEEQFALRQASWQNQQNEKGVIVRTSGGLSDDWTFRRYEPENLWAYQPVDAPDLAASDENPIDILINRQLALLEVSAAPSADAQTLIRRATFDVLGLPPTPSEVRSFVDQWRVDSEQAWSQLVDRLLTSPHYGEQAARHWLDVVRYADSSGFANDWERPNAWRYRDYVIRSFNDDKPYDQFVLEQLAGDELNAHDPEMKVALGFLRMGPWEHSAMSVAKVSRQQFLDDVTDAVGQVFLAHPLQCARCHDHKFDPVPTQDYYALQAVFATTQLADVEAAWLPAENLTGMDYDQRVHQKKLEWNQANYDDLQNTIAEREQEWFRSRNLPFTSRVEAKQADAPDEQIPEPRVGLTTDELGRERLSGRWRLRFNWEKIRYQPRALSVYNGKTNLPGGVAKPTPVPADPLGDGVLETTAVLAGGDPFSPTEIVTPGVLSVATHGQPYQITQQSDGRRLALAEWLVDPENPLTARVMVNRIWQSHFGRGIAGTPNNFGAMGKKPTHPELLDFLAATFIDEGWSMKKLHRMILTSKAYRRASEHPHPDLLDQTDPRGESYAVFRPRRLVAEEIRDVMLAISGELNTELGGIPARPDMNLEVARQPRLIMGTLAPSYVPNAEPGRRNRRSIYALKLRGLRDPFFEVFNQPSPDIVCEMRDQSNVTPQVFSLLNSQESTDRALALAKRVVDAAETDETAISRLFWLVFGREPSAEEVIATVEHWHEMQAAQSTIKLQPAEYPSEIVRRANEENSGETFEFVERLFEYEDYQPDLQPHEVDARTRGLADVCLMLLNSNGFVYVY